MNNSQISKKQKSYKIVFVGPQAAGKTSMLNQLVSEKFQESYTSTIGVDFKLIKVNVESRQISVQLWDTAGQQNYFKGAHGVICVYDLQDKNSLKRCQYYLQQALNENINPECVYVVGNKSDKGREFSEQGQQLAKNYEVKFQEVSAKSGEGIKQLINSMGSLLVSKVGQIEEKQVELRPNIQIKDAESKCRC